MPKKYILKCWTPTTNNREFDSQKEAQEEKEHLEEMQPENIYEIAEIDEEVPF